MKKTLLAIAIPAALLATSAQAVELYDTDAASVDFYGQLRTELVFKKSEDATLSAGSSRSGVNASYVVTDSLSVFGTFEFGLSGNGGDLENRLHFTGVETDYGKLSFGKQWTVADDIWAAEYSYKFGGASLVSELLNGGMHNSLIKYNLDTENFWIAANVGLSEDDSEQSLYEAFIGTSFGDLALHAGYGVNANDVAGTKFVGVENTYYEVTAEYSIGNSIVGFTYYNAELEKDVTSQEISIDAFALAGSYALTDQVNIYTGLELLSYASTNIAEDLKDSTTFTLGTDYQINDFSKVYVEYGYSDGSSVSFEQQSSILTGETVEDEHKAIVGFRVYW